MGRRHHVVTERERISDVRGRAGGRNRHERRREDIVAEERRTHRRAVGDAARRRIGRRSEVIAHPKVEGFRSVHRGHVLLFLQLDYLTETAFVLVVDKVTARSVRAEADRVKRAAQFGLVLGMASERSQLRQAVSELTLVAVFTVAALFKRATKFRLVPTRVDVLTAVHRELAPQRQFTFDAALLANTPLQLVVMARRVRHQIGQHVLVECRRGDHHVVVVVVVDWRRRSVRTQ